MKRAEKETLTAIEARLRSLARLEYLDENMRRTQDMLDLMATLWDLQLKERTHGHGRQEILSLTLSHLSRIASFNCQGFLLTRPPDFAFTLEYCNPEDEREPIQQELDKLIENATFAWALNQNRTIMVPAAHAAGHTVVLHALATKTEVLGMFVGLLPTKETRELDRMSQFFSMIIFNCAQAMENLSLADQVQELMVNLQQANIELARDKELLEERVRQRTEEVEAANSAKSEFMAKMSHELRTPLNAIIGFAELMETAKTAGETRRYSNQIITESNALLSLINELLDMARIESGHSSLRNAPFALREFLRTIEASMGLAASEKGLAFKVAVDEGVPDHLLGDANRLRGILVNLIYNATKFTEDGSVSVCGSLVSRAGNEIMLRFEIEDTGMGIAEKDITRIFERFAQVDEGRTRQYGGTGLGTYISKQLVEMMGGEIGVKSTPGKGSTFWFTCILEVLDPTSAEAMEPIDETPEKTTAKTLKSSGGRILIVEDYSANQEVALLHLSGAGYTCEVVENGKKAVARAQIEPFDLILMDIQMPVMDGYEATRQIRAGSSRNQGVPIVAMTANAYDEDREACFAAGMSDVITKPLRRESFLGTIGQYIQALPAGSIQTLMLSSEGDEVNMEQAPTARQFEPEKNPTCIKRLSKTFCHDFRNVLSPCFGYGDALKGISPEDARLQRYVNEILVAAENALDMVNGLEAEDSTSEEGQLIDFPRALAAHKGAAARLHDLLHSFMTEAEVRIQKGLPEALLNDDLSRVQQEARLIQESANALFINSLSVIAGELAEEARAGNSKRCTVQLARLDAAFDALRNYIYT